MKLELTMKELLEKAREWLKKLAPRIAIPAATAVAVLAGAATASADSFNMTNGVNGGAIITSYPTNTMATNSTTAGVAVGQATGAAIEVKNCNFATFYVRGWPATNTANGFTNYFSLVRSVSDNPPTVTYGTNGLYFANNTWDSTNWTQIPVVVPPGTNFFEWSTNLQIADLGGATYVGLLQYSNFAGGGTVTFTNLDAGLKKKIIPIRYP